MNKLFATLAVALALGACSKSTEAPEAAAETGAEPSKIFDMPYLMRDLDNGLRVSRLKQEGKPIPGGLALKYKIANKLVFHKIQAALGDPSEALVDNAGSVLQKLVDGGILLALTTTIVGGVGSYLMRLGKAMAVGARLNAFYEAHNRRDMGELIEVTRRLESTLLENADRMTRADRIERRAGREDVFRPRSEAV